MTKVGIEWISARLFYRRISFCSANYAVRVLGLEPRTIRLKVECVTRNAGYTSDKYAIARIS